MPLQQRFQGPDSALVRWLEEPATPLRFMGVAAAAFWAFEAALHALYFDYHSFWRDLVAPDGHELWMRLVVIGMLLVIGFVWRTANIERRERISALEEYQARLQALTGQLARAESEERHALARRLHDDVGQQLAAARMFLASVDQSSVGDEAALRSASRILERVIAGVREVSEELSPHSLDEYGLSEALDSVARRIMRRTGSSIDLEISAGCGALPRDSALVGFQATIEILELAARECATGRVALRCTDLADCIEITLTWPGVTHELFSATQRIRGIGGSLDSTMIGDTTSVRICIPRAA